MQHVRTLTMRSQTPTSIDLDLVADLSRHRITAATSPARTTTSGPSCSTPRAITSAWGLTPTPSPLSPSDDMSFDPLRLAKHVAEIEKPVICAIHGSTYDQGLEVALACDVRIADATAKFRMGHILSGEMPWDGGTQRLPRLIGPSRAHEMLLTGREIDAAEALDFGIVNQVVEPGAASQRAHEVAEAMTKHGPIAMRYLKEAVLSGLDGTLEQGLRLEADLSFLLQSTDDRREGIESFLQRRSPTYRGQ